MYLLESYPVLPILSFEQRQAAIARRAYEKWVKRSCPAGTALQDWMDAEAEFVSLTEAGKNHDFHWPHLGNSVPH